MTQLDRGPTFDVRGLHRRELMLGLGMTVVVASGVAATGAGRAAGTPAAAVPDAFAAATRFVTASTPDSAAVARAWQQLTALDTHFAGAVTRFTAAVRSAGLKDMAGFLASPLAHDKDLTATARTITATWYLGFTGTPNDRQAADTTGFVTLVGALMYRPTMDATIIPTFSRGRTDFWIDPPAGTPVPPGPAGVPQWQGSGRKTPVKTKA